MAAETLERILDIYDELRPRHPLNLKVGEERYPRVSFAGGGDPLMHPRATWLIQRCSERGYETLLVTNASLLNPGRTEELLDSGISEIYCSFWGIEQDEYEAAMKLPYARTLANVERLAPAAAARGIPFRITWVHVPQVRSTPAQVSEFWAARGIEVDVADNDVWNRAGLLDLTGLGPAPAVVPPDPARRIWCADLYFTDAWSWDGRCLLCSCNYFHAIPHVLGDLSSTAGEISAAKQRILGARPLPRRCQECLLPRSKQSVWLAEPWFPHVDESERRMVTYAR
jgi:hypothetical protein